MIILFVCFECGSIFSEPLYWEETHGLDSPPYEQWSGCPYCKGDYIEAFKCDCCEEWITDSYIKTDDDKRYCENCFTKRDLGDE